MNNSNSLISTREASEICGYSLRHIQGMIKKGKLSATRDEGGSYLIDKSELYRVFPNAHTPRTDTNEDEQSARIVLEAQIAHLREMIAEKNKHNEFLLCQLQSATTEKTILMETLSSNQRLLEYSNKNKRKKFLGIF